MTMSDGAVHAVYQLAFDPVVETQSDPNSFGFRKGRSQHDAVAYIRSALDKSTSPRFILETDIAKCFYNISYDFLLGATPIYHKHVMREWLNSGYIFEGLKHSTDAREGGEKLCNVAPN